MLVLPRRATPRQMMTGMSTPVPTSFWRPGASECHTRSGVFPQRGPFTHVYRDGGRAITTRRASFRVANTTAALESSQRKWKNHLVWLVYILREMFKQGHVRVSNS